MKNSNVIIRTIVLLAIISFGAIAAYNFPPMWDERHAYLPTINIFINNMGVFPAGYDQLTTPGGFIVQAFICRSIGASAEDAFFLLRVLNVIAAGVIWWVATASDNKRNYGFYVLTAAALLGTYRMVDIFQARHFIGALLLSLPAILMVREYHESQKIEARWSAAILCGGLCLIAIFVNQFAVVVMTSATAIIVTDIIWDRKVFRKEDIYKVMMIPVLGLIGAGIVAASMFTGHITLPRQHTLWVVKKISLINAVVPLYSIGWQFAPLGLLLVALKGIGRKAVVVFSSLLVAGLSVLIYMSIYQRGGKVVWGFISRLVDQPYVNNMLAGPICFGALTFWGCITIGSLLASPNKKLFAGGLALLGFSVVMFFNYVRFERYYFSALTIWMLVFLCSWIGADDDRFSISPLLKAIIIGWFVFGLILGGVYCFWKFLAGA